MRIAMLMWMRCSAMAWAVLLAGGCTVDQLPPLGDAAAPPSARSDAAASDAPANDAARPDAPANDAARPDGPPDARDGEARPDAPPPVDGSPATAPMMCAGTAALPAFDKTCAVDADCAAVTHQINCCGTLVALGINKRLVTAFNDAEKACAASYPACGCASQPTRTEDGSMQLGFDGGIAVKCQSGSCTTFIKGCGDPCGAGTSCFCCPTGPQSYCACTTPCTSNTECKTPGLTTCQTGGFPKFCAANVACWTR
jgi:hypothetical protein